MVPKLKIERIECIPLSMPLPRTFRGSNYFMTHRCTIITRRLHREGIVGEVYNGDEFETQAEVLKIIHEEIEPQLIGMDAFNIEGCWEKIASPPPTSCATASSATCAQACVDSAIWDAVGKALDVPLYKLWGGYADRLPVVCIAGYYEEGKTLADFGREMEQIRTDGLPAASSRSAGARRRRTPSASAPRAPAAGDDFVLIVDANQGWSAAPGGRVLAPRRGPEHPLVRGAGALAQRPARHGRGAQRDRHSGLRRAERDQPRRLPRPDDGGAIDVCNFDASWGGGPTEWRRVAALAQSFSGSRWAITRSRRFRRICSLRSPTAPIWKPFIRDRDPMFYALVANRSNFDNGYYQVPQGAGFGIEMDKSVIEKYRV